MYWLTLIFYTKRKMLKKVKNILFLLLPGATLILIWQLYVSLNARSEFYLGSPFGVAKEFYTSLFYGNLALDFSVTLTEAVIGFLMGVSLGTLFGLLLWLSTGVYKIAKPYLIILGALPVFALGPILIFWFGTGMFSKIVIGFLSTFVISLTQSYNGAIHADRNLLVLIQSFGGTKMDIFKRIVVPSSFVWVLAGARINISMALLGAFVGEFISSKAGLGHHIIIAEGLFNVNQIWVGVIGLVLIALLFNYSTLPFERMASKRSQ